MAFFWRGSRLGVRARARAWLAVHLAALSVGGCGRTDGDFPRIVPRLQIATRSLAPARIRIAYTAVLEVAEPNRHGELTWQLTEGNLPPGLVLSSPQGPQSTIMGIPQTLGMFPFTVEVTNALGDRDTASLILEVTPDGALAIVTETLPPGRVDEDYLALIEVNGANAQPVRWTVADGELPEGLVLASTPGVAQLRGTPTLADSYRFELRAEAGDAEPDQKPFVLLIDEPFLISIDIIDGQPVGPVGLPFAVVLRGRGGNLPFTWFVDDLPPGLTFRELGLGRELLIEGVPTETGRFTTRVGVTDARMQTGQRSVSIQIR